MALKCGIVGLPNVGKSTLFNCVSYNGITFAIDLGQRGFGSTFVKEKYIGFHVGFNIFDIWFRKPQYQ